MDLDARHFLQMPIEQLQDFLERQGLDGEKQKIFFTAIAFIALVVAAFFFLQIAGNKTVLVKITDRETGGPIDAKVTITTFSQVLAVKDSANGTVIFEGVSKNEKTRVIVEKEGYKSVGVELEPDQATVEVS